MIIGAAGLKIAVVVVGIALAITAWAAIANAFLTGFAATATLLAGGIIG